MKMLISVNAMSIRPSRAENTGRMRVGTHASPLVDYQFSPAFTCGERPAKVHCRVPRMTFRVSLCFRLLPSSSMIPLTRMILDVQRDDFSFDEAYTSFR